MTIKRAEITVVLSRNWFWRTLALLIALFYGFLALREAFAGEYLISDDGRQHIFWLQRYVDPRLFPQDLIADYFQTVAPAGYKFLYWLGAQLGLTPIFFSKLLPIILLTVTAAYCFEVCLGFFPVPAAAACASVLLSQGLAMTDAIFSATPKAFIYPLFLGFSYYLLRESLWGCSLAILLLGLFYPQMMLVAAGLLLVQMLPWPKDRSRLIAHRPKLWLCGVGLGIAAAILLIYALTTTEFDPVVSVAQARRMPEFLAGGAIAVFRR
ncbi:MAG: hypothetical protein HC890_01945 [Chloroflexaceae bacterium]|nr:hypothetical protein [Chloroflexaceae bacterium]